MSSVQVGNQCLSQAEAENYLLSQSAPLLTEDGVIKPEYVNGQWTYHGTAVSLNLPPCSPSDNFQNGVILGWAFVAVLAAAFVFRMMKWAMR